MNYERKQLIVQALIKLVQSAPDVQTRISYSYSWSGQNYNISTQEYANWVDYVYSVLDTTYGYTGLDLVYKYKMNIMQITNQGGSYLQLISQIKNEILSLAQEILQFY